MQQDWYDGMWALEGVKYWWYDGRRAIVESVVRRCVSSRSGRKVLDVGAGEEFGWLSAFGTVTGVDMEPRVIERKRLQTSTPEQLFVGALPNNMPFVRMFDIVFALDVLEHIEDHESALRVLHDSYISPQGYVVMTMPAHAWLWSPHDTKSAHFRRYTRHELLALLEKTGFTVLSLSYYQFFLLPFIYAVKTLHRLWPTRFEKHIVRVPNPFINTILTVIMQCEAWLLQWGNLPTGAALVVVAQKKG